MDIKSMPTEDLRAILKKDCNSDNPELGDEEIFSILGELALREGKSSEYDAKEAWNRFKKYWIPGVRDITQRAFSGSAVPEGNIMKSDLTKEHFQNDLISRQAAHANLGELELFAYLTDDDIREHGLYTDENGFYFTEEQARIAGVMYVLMRRYIKDFPAAENPTERRGHWIYDSEGPWGPLEIYCPWCGKPALYPEEEDRPLETPFCPHCGAIMDESIPFDSSWPFAQMSLRKMKKMEAAHETT